jgi:single-strand DNA-binding protein
MANKVIFSGYLGADPDTRTAGETTATEVRIADTERWKDKNGEKREKTTWWKVIFWGKSGETVAKYFRKGAWIYTESSITTRTYEDKDGKKVYVTEGRGIKWEFGPKTESSGSGSGSGPGSDYDPGPTPDDDIPF